MDVVSGELLSPVSLYMDPITEQQAECIRMLVMGVSAKATAKHLGLSRETISRWRKAPNFKAALEKAAGGPLALIEAQLGAAESGIVGALAAMGEYIQRVYDGDQTRVSGLDLPTLQQTATVAKTLAEIRALTQGRPTQISESRTAHAEISSAEQLRLLREGAPAEAEEGDTEE
jgi:hypothetical protein